MISQRIRCTVLLVIVFHSSLSFSGALDFTQTPEKPVTENNKSEDNNYLDKYEESLEPFFDVDRYRQPSTKIFSSPTMIFHAGNMNSETQQVLTNESVSTMLGFTTQQDLEKDFTAFEVSVLLLSRSYDTSISAPLFSSYSDKMTLETAVISAGGRLFWPEARQFRVFASTGLALYMNTMSVSVVTFIFPGTVEERSTDIKPYITAGFEFFQEENIFQLQYRYMPFSGSFPDFDIPSTELGGSSILLGYGFIW